MDARRNDQLKYTYGPKSLWLWLICGILVCQAAGITAWSRYSQKRDGEGNAVIASLVTEAEFSIDVNTLPTKPGENTIVNFMVTNYEGNHVSETLLQYTARLETAGNLPLKFSLAPSESGGTVDGNWIASGEVEGNHDSPPGYLRQGEKVAHYYTLTVSWPLETGDSDEQYADEIDYVRIKIHANQVSPESV